MAAVRAAPAREPETAIPRQPWALLARREGNDAIVLRLDVRDVKLRSMIGIGKDPGTVLADIGRYQLPKILKCHQLGWKV
jgi:hypothetical protein